MAKHLVKSKSPLKGKGLDTNEIKEIDWHDYKAIAEEQQRTGLGEQGSAVILTAEEEKKKGDLYKVNGFNAYASDKISLQRALKDIRHEQCKNKKYLNKLPTASIIVPFHNEHWSTLLRTAQSVIDRSPPHLLQEVILVDDFSSKEHCKQQLDDYVAEHYTKVRIVRAEKREGLIRTRLLGARAAKGDVLIFLDSHCEVNINWLPPLLDPIARDQKTVVCPFIDVIDYETFAYRAQDEGARGAFDWEFFYKRLPLLPEDKKHPADPFKSPVMAGGLFAIHQEWFWMLGGYDPGLDIWGGEQYELSFKIWQCGGMMVDSPCSRIGHVYRKFAPFPNPGVGDFIGRNYKRVAEVWMDEYAEYLYKRRPHYKTLDAGDLTEQKAIRDKLHCKSFKWFMTEVAFDLVKVYPPIEPTPMASGEVRNQANEKCIDTRFKGQNERFQLESCIKDGQGAGGEQQFEFSWHKDIRPKSRAVCFDAAHSAPKSPVILYNCHGMGGNQRFKYNLQTNQIFHPVSGQCLDCDKENLEVFMNPCDADSETQKWKWEKINLKDVKKDWSLPLD
ncbi:hypothetical protein LOTGIDRAFT_239085 [Lottia gigantea]|uniref:Polypeptide N-acetylgalactosaminyltransferase n=1 Tax=Lottia gigantea TaxID=225164 RepID=V4ALX2_LOTGI|nr:hypothetical protein LOTGIDRAFT_239085 [Lottia gigantea]ESO98122.1 hypothetical protein LOTGIDRAFT_239085 [Lottia gigantea]